MKHFKLRLGLLDCIPTRMVTEPPVLRWGSALGMVLSGLPTLIFLKKLKHTSFTPAPCYGGGGVVVGKRLN